MTNNQQSPARILIVGAGAIGAFYGAALQAAGADVSVVCRSEFDAVQQHGYRIRSRRLGERRLLPAQTLRAAGDYVGGAPDYLLLCVKVVEGTDRIGLIRDVVGPATRIVLIENGIEIEQEIAQAFPGNELISALAFVQVSRTGPGEIEHYAFGDLTFGSYPEGISGAARTLGALLEAGGVKCTLTGEVATARWQKCVWNAVFNPVSVLGAALDTDDILGAAGGAAFIERAMREVCAIAAAGGHPLPDALPAQFIEGTRKAPPYKTSMALDFEHGRPMETEVILGNAVRAAHREKVAAPLLETLYALMKMVERKAGKI